MSRYTLDDYLKKSRFVQGVEQSGIQTGDIYVEDDEIVNKKRELLKLLGYQNLFGEGRRRIPLAECSSFRINQAYKQEYHRAVKFVGEFKAMESVRGCMDELLRAEEEVALVFRQMPLFAQPVSHAKKAVESYVRVLTPEQARFVREFFGNRVTQYFSEKE